MATAELDQHEAWFAPDSEVAVLEYHGLGHYSAEPATVSRVTAAQIIVKDGRRFWRHKCGMQLVGSTDRRNGGQAVNLIRIVPLSNPHAAKLLSR